jgi:hypothetical protein
MRNRIRRALRAMMAAQAPRPSRASTTTRVADQVTIIATEGVIQQVDPVSRELPVLIDGASRHFYVPLQCSISLNHEPVKMRLLQPQDRARLEYSIEHGVSTAHSITVQCCGEPEPQS